MHLPQRDLSVLARALADSRAAVVSARPYRSDQRKYDGKLIGPDICKPLPGARRLLTYCCCVRVRNPIGDFQ